MGLMYICIRFPGLKKILGYVVLVEGYAVRENVRSYMEDKSTIFPATVWVY